MTDAQRIVHDIMVGLKSVQGQSPVSLIGKDPFQLPRLIYAGSARGMIQITKEIDDDISSLARTLKLSRPALVRTVKDYEWRTLVRSEIGPLLADPALANPATAAPLLLSKLESALDAATSALAVREHAFGATLFSNSDVPTFAIGPVTFEPREAWLDRKVVDGDIDKVMQRRLKKYWDGSHLARRKNNRDHLREDDIIKAIGPCHYVCSVRLSASFASDAGLETSLTAARLAIASMALAFESASQALQGFRLWYDGPIFQQKALLFIPGRVILSGSRISGRPHGPLVSAQDWQNELVARASMFAGCDEVLDNLVDPSRSMPRAGLLDALLQSLMWFEKGCREQGDQMAIVAFAASLDALGKGTKVNGILKVMKARLGIEGSDPINASGPTFKSVLEVIYSEGRSRSIHGTSDRIGFDWGETRARAEQISRYTLIACLDRTAQTPTALTTDDLKL